jgi:hypothetical protein
MNNLNLSEILIICGELCREGLDAAKGPNAKSMKPENAAKCLLVNSCPDLVNVAKCIWILAMKSLF